LDFSKISGNVYKSIASKKFKAKRNIETPSKQKIPASG